MSLKITTEEMDNRQLAVTIEVDQARVDRHLRKAARDLAGQYRIPGFRKGKAPFNIMVQYLGMDALYGEFVDELGQQVYREALEQDAFKPYAQAALEEITVDPLIYKLIVPLEPTVDLGDYRSLRVEEEPVELEEEEVTRRLEAYQEDLADWEEVDGPSKYSDSMSINVRSVIAAEDEDGDEVVVLDELDWDVIPDEEDPMEPPGFDAALVGLQSGDEVEFDLSWPEDSQSIYAGKTAHYVVQVNSIDRYQKPALDDDFAQMVGPDYETLDDLLKDIRDSLREEAEEMARDKYLGQVFDAALRIAKLDYPPIVVEDQIDAMVDDYRQRLRQYGIEDVEAFFEQTGQNIDEYRENLRENAIKIVERNLLLAELMEAEKLKVTDAELEARIQEFMGESGLDADSEDEEVQASVASLAQMFRSESGRVVFESQIMHAKAVERMLAIARGEEIPEPENDEAADESGETGESDDVETDVVAAQSTVGDEGENAGASENAPDVAVQADA